MKLWIVSDLHLDASPWSPATIPAYDVMVIAGDIANGTVDSMYHHREIQRRTGRPVVMVPGNHDLFDCALSRFDAILDGPRIVLPRGQSVVIGGIRFVGATLWTDWQVNDKEFQAQAWAARHMPEYSHVVREDGELIWPIDIYAEHQRHRAAIDELLSVPHDGPTVVVTHHAPSIQSIHPGDRTDPSAAAYASDLEELIMRRQPALWVHGHVHHASDYRVGDTRVVCNPRGYVGADWSERTDCNEALVIDV